MNRLNQMIDAIHELQDITPIDSKIIKTPNGTLRKPNAQPTNPAGDGPVWL